MTGNTVKIMSFLKVQVRMLLQFVVAIFSSSVAFTHNVYVIYEYLVKSDN